MELSKHNYEMLFDIFLASRRSFEYSDLSRKFRSDNCLPSYASGLAYLCKTRASKIYSCCYILKQPGSKLWFLPIENCEYESFDLDRLERILFEWQLDN